VGAELLQLAQRMRPRMKVPRRGRWRVFPGSPKRFTMLQAMYAQTTSSEQRADDLHLVPLRPVTPLAKGGENRVRRWRRRIYEKHDRRLIQCRKD